jgi:hypothetical protein
MRYYRIEITKGDGSPALDAKGNEIGAYTSFVNGKTIMGALNVELDIPLYTFDAPQGAAFVRIWGVGLWVVAQAANLNGLKIKVFAGMQKGLPLANIQPNPGIILQGVIQQAFSNYQGAVQTLDMIVQGDYGSQSEPKNLVLDCPAGTSLGDSVTKTLQSAFPNYPITTNLSPNLVFNADLPAFYPTLNSLNAYLQGISKHIIGGKDYQGIKITFKNGGLSVFDGTDKTVAEQLRFIDLIGQPSWIDAGTINFKTVLRADFQVGDYVKLPTQGIVATTAQSYSQYRDSSAFKGKFLLTSVRHLGNFRQRDANSWVTVFNAATVPDE